VEKHHGFLSDPHARNLPGHRVGDEREQGREHGSDASEEEGERRTGHAPGNPTFSNVGKSDDYVRACFDAEVATRKQHNSDRRSHGAPRSLLVAGHMLEEMKRRYLDKAAIVCGVLERRILFCRRTC
jgi:hypothetical protein